MFYINLPTEPLFFVCFVTLLPSFYSFFPRVSLLSCFLTKTNVVIESYSVFNILSTTIHSVNCESQYFPL